jgi:anaerobic ribonucleoside-triphosphate reductase activating protein
MRYADITTCDIANGEGIGVVLWCQGCSINCPGCQNKCTHEAADGKEFFTKFEEDLIIKELRRPQISRLTLSGGHPLEPYNVITCLPLCQRVKFELPDICIWCYTGWLWEHVKDMEIMKYIDVLVDGPYVESLRDITLPWRGSSNQRVIDVQASLKKNKVVLYE